MHGLVIRTGIAAGLLALAAVPAVAQKSKDTMRFTGSFATRTLDAYLETTPTADTLSEAVFDTLVVQDLDTGEIAPLLAKSWTQVNPTTLEFVLRDDVKWHDGKPFTADDAVYTLSWLTDPSTAITNKANWAWIDKVEKVDDHKIRVISKQPTPYALMRLAWFTPMYPKHIYSVGDKATFGQKPVGTGPYKAVSVDINGGYILEKNPDYKWGGKAKPQNNFQRFEARGAPDVSVQIARVVVGDTDFIQLVGTEQFAQVKAQKPEYSSYKGRSQGWNLIAIPSSGQKMNPALADVRVRRAIMMAIDMKSIELLRSGDATLWKSLCDEKEPGCGFNVPPPPYDPAGAKRLLAEAGYANGIDLNITTLSTSGTRTAAEAAAGYLNAVGIRAKLDPIILPAYRKRLADKQVEVAISGESSGMIPDASSMVLPFFMGQYFDDPKLLELAKKTLTIMDDKERRKAMAELLDYSNENALLVPMQGLTRFVVSNPDVDLKPIGLTPYPEAYSFRRLNFKK